MANPITKTEKIRALDGLRGLAALAVVFHHIYQQFYLKPTLNHLVYFDWLGSWGVTLFFVLSGFCIHHSQAAASNNADHSIDVKRFAVNRIFRIAPAYLVAFLICILISNFWISSLISKPKSFFDIASHLLFIHNCFPNTFYSINAVFWTIAVESQFYFIYAFLFKSFSFKFSQVFILMIFSILSYGIFSFFLSQENSWRMVFQNSVLVSFWIWYLGAALAEFTAKKIDILPTANTKPGKVSLIIIVVLLITLLLAYTDLTVLRMHVRIWISPLLCGLLIYSIVKYNSSTSKVIEFSKRLKWLGDISYSLYLLHPIAITAAIKFAGGDLLKSIAYSLIISFFLAWLSYTYIEIPFMAIRHKLIQSIA